MNRIALGFALCLACGTAIAEWTPVGGNPKIFAAYADKASIRKAGDSVEMLGLYDFLMPDGRWMRRSLRSRVLVNL